MKIVGVHNFLEELCHEGKQRSAGTSRKIREIFSPQMGQINVFYTTEVNDSVELGKLISLDCKKRKWITARMRSLRKYEGLGQECRHWLWRRLKVITNPRSRHYHISLTEVNTETQSYISSKWHI